ncbi:MAG: OmpA family protein [Verrucomicrobiaceae bacterium]|nr:OmpA family protein [Verrucomicrobiaceae bacterium]
MRSRHPGVSGGSYTPVIFIVAGLAISAAVFFLFTRKKLEDRPAAATAPLAAQQGNTGSEAKNAAGGQPGKVAVTAPAEPTTPPSGTPNAPAGSAMQPPTAPGATKTTQATALGFARPGDLGTQMARALSTGDIAQAAKMAAAGDPSRATEAEAVFKKLFTDMGLKAAPDDQMKILGQVGDATRLSIPLLKPGQTVPTISLQIDVERDPKMGWKITQFRLPDELAPAIAAAMATPGAPASTPGAAATSSTTEPTAAALAAGAKMTPPVAGSAPAGTTPATAGTTPAAAPKGGTPLFVVEQHADALGFASGFVTSLLGRDFSSARKVIDESKVPVEKLAGLCIVFEEGDYQLKPSKPLIITVASPNVSWVIAQVESESLQQSTEFGLELQRGAESQPWKVVGLNLSELLGSFAQVASKIGVPYTPVVQNPKGGESLALYFEYDQAQLHERAQKQLHIVAELLKSNSARKLRITGHTDAMGTDDYNVALSQARAKSVKEQLVALGVSVDQVITEGMGKAVPLSPNQKADGTDDPEGRSKNRRAEIFLDF